MTLAERLWPALQDIDTSSGALGAAVDRTLVALIPVLIEAPADLKTRAKWLERLWQAIGDDGVEYLQPIADRWGEIAVFPDLIAAHADGLLPLIRRVWAEEAPGAYVTGASSCLSCLLELGRHAELLELLTAARQPWWHYHRYGAEALRRQGLWQDAIAYAERCLDSKSRQDDSRVGGFCESVLLEAGAGEQAYRQYGLRMPIRSTYLAAFRELLRRYPERDGREVLSDLIVARGEAGKWFAAARSAGYLDIALECARSPDTEPATLIRAARDCVSDDPKFATNVALLAIWHLLSGRGYQPNVSQIDAAADVLERAARNAKTADWVCNQMRSMVEGKCSPSAEHLRSALSERMRRQGHRDDNASSSP